MGVLRLRETPSNLNLPNTLTVLRILLVPVLVQLLVQERYVAAIVVFAVAGFTDGLDGFIARRWDRRTRVGAFLDPLADKLLVVSSVVMLAHHGLLPVWLASAIVGRDVVIVSGVFAFRIVTGRFEVAPSRLSKMNTVAQIVLVLLVLMDGAGVVGLARWLPFLFLVVLGTTLASGVQYVVVWGRRAAELRARGPSPPADGKSSGRANPCERPRESRHP
jgi:cardiolipin synthase